MDAGTTTAPHTVALSKSGWLEKFSVGRGIFPFRNWQRRYVVATHAGLNYSSSSTSAGEARTFVPFASCPDSSLNNNSSNSSTLTSSTAVAAVGVCDVVQHPVFLIPVVSSSLHPEAKDQSSFSYFGIRFQEKGNVRVLLFRTTDAADRQQWVGSVV